MIAIGVSAWIPYFALKLSGTEVVVAPFLIAHLAFIIPGALLAPSETLIQKLARRFTREDDQIVM